MVFEKYVWLRFFRPHSDRQGTQWWSWSHTRSVPRTSPVIVMVMIVILMAMLMMTLFTLFTSLTTFSSILPNKVFYPQFQIREMINVRNLRAASFAMKDFWPRRVLKLLSRRTCFTNINFCSAKERFEPSASRSCQLTSHQGS